MATRSSSALPVQVLRDHVDTLERAMAECVKDPSEKTVHRLRTSTRRIEGQLALLAALPDAPTIRKEDRLRRALKKARRKAGEVRDIDVEEELLKKIAGRRSTAALGKDRDALMERLEDRRARAAESLVRLLRKRGDRLSRLLRAALEDLDPHRELAIEGGKLAQLAQDWFLLSVREGDEMTEDVNRLHGMRKTAKLARYMAENAPRSSVAKRNAERFEALQEAGGKWHDCLVLGEIAEARVGRDSPLAGVLKRRCSSDLKAFRRLLASTLHQAPEGSLSRAGRTAERRPRNLRRR